MIYKIGDTIKLVSKRPIFWNPEGAMDCFLGSVQKIKFIDCSGRPVFENPDTHRWSFKMSDIESLVMPYPKVMWVSDNEREWHKRVVFMEKCGRFIAWVMTETIEEAEDVFATNDWKYAKDVLPTVELTIPEIAEKFQLQPEQIRIKE